VVEVTVLLTLALVAFAGGAFGAAVGGYPAFSLAGLVIVLGEVAKISQTSVAQAGPIDSAALGSTGLTASIGLGPGFGPHVALGGGVAAAAYAARRGYLDTDSDYHPAKDVTTALGTDPDVLLVGGLFGVLGLLITTASVGAGLPWDPIAFAIVVSAFLHRIAFGYPLIGNVRGGILDMSPFERNEHRRRRVGSDGGVDADGGSLASARYVVEPWLPHQYRWANVAFIGAIVGVFSAFVCYRTGSPFLAFGITAFSVAFLCLGSEKFPVTHHMALPASILVVGLAGAADPSVLANGVTGAEFQSTVSLVVALVAGGVMGAVAGVLGEVSERVLYAHADTHLDPPAAAIVLSTLLIAALDIAGVITQNIIPTF
jgi:hypothetical protein